MEIHNSDADLSDNDTDAPRLRTSRSFEQLRYLTKQDKQQTETLVVPESSKLIQRRDKGAVMSGYLKKRQPNAIIFGKWKSRY